MIIAASLSACRIPPPGEDSVRAVDQLTVVTEFGFGGRDLSARRTDGEHAFFTILHSRRAPELFRETFERGTPEARLYALFGLRVTDRSSYKRYSARLAAENQIIHMIRGRLVYTNTWTELVGSFDMDDLMNYIKLAKDNGLDN